MRIAARERKALGRRLRTARKKIGFSQEKAAEAIGIHPVHVSRLEAGLHNPTLSVIIAASIAYRVPLKDFFTDDED